MAKVDYFLKVDGIDGESHDDKFAKNIELESWSWGESNSGGFAHGSGGGAGKVSMQDFHFVMLMNNASANLAQACATGKHIAFAELAMPKFPDGDPGPHADRRRDALDRAGYTEAAVSGLLGADELPTARRLSDALPLHLWRTRTATPLATLVRLLLLGRAVPPDA